MRDAFNLRVDQLHDIVISPPFFHFTFDTKVQWLISLPQPRLKTLEGSSISVFIFSIFYIRSCICGWRPWLLMKKWCPNGTILGALWAVQVIIYVPFSLLHSWIQILHSNWKKLIYFVAGWVQIKCELRLLSKFSFNLNPEWELDGKKDEAQPIQEGVKDMLITHHLFSWDLWFLHMHLLRSFNYTMTTL